MTTQSLPEATMDRLREEALSLPRLQRAALAKDLISSLEPELDPVIEAEWAAVALERSRAYDAGETTACNWRESVARIRATLDARSAARTTP